MTVKKYMISSLIDPTQTTLNAHLHALSLSLLPFVLHLVCSQLDRYLEFIWKSTLPKFHHPSIGYTSKS